MGWRSGQRVGAVAPHAVERGHSPVIDRRAHIRGIGPVRANDDEGVG